METVKHSESTNNNSYRQRKSWITFMIPAKENMPSFYCLLNCLFFLAMVHSLTFSPLSKYHALFFSFFPYVAGGLQGNRIHWAHTMHAQLFRVHKESLKYVIEKSYCLSIPFSMKFLQRLCAQDLSTVLFTTCQITSRLNATLTRKMHCCFKVMKKWLFSK